MYFLDPLKNLFLNTDFTFMAFSVSGYHISSNNIRFTFTQYWHMRNSVS